MRKGERLIAKEGKKRRVAAYITWYEIEPLLVELVRLGEIRRADAEVTQLVYRRRPLLEALEAVDASFLLQGLYYH